MMVTCESCRQTLSLDETVAGTKVTCPGCGRMLTVPALPRTENIAGAGRHPASRADQPTSDHGRAGGPGDDLRLTEFLAPAELRDELGRLGGFRILKVLGRGGMGIVFEGEDPQLGRRVAIKAMLPHLAVSESSQLRFLREARSAAALEHEHIVAVHAVGQERGAPFIVMPFLKGESLDRRLQSGPKLSLRALLRIGREIAEGLAAAHAAGLVHRDIKPANIWLEAPRERVKILDFGLARPVVDATVTQQGDLLGTPAFMAPEQGRGAPIDARTDLWSLGVVLYLLSTGRLPFQGRDGIATLMSVAMDRPAAPAEVNRAVPPELSQLIMKLLSKDPAGRCRNAAEVVAALRELELQFDPLGPARRVLAKVEQGLKSTAIVAVARTRKRPWRAGLLAVLAALVVAGVIVLWPTPHGLVRIESDDPAVEIVFDQVGPTIKGIAAEPIHLRAGSHAIQVKRGGLSFETDKLLIKNGDRITLKVELVKGKVQVSADGQVLGGAELPAAKGGTPGRYVNRLGMEFVLVPRGKAWLGSREGRPAQREVQLDHDFYLGIYEVTQEQWAKVMGGNPSQCARDGSHRDDVQQIPDDELKRFPVDFVSWQDCQDFAARLNEALQEEGWLYRLPTEIEWEYACRGGPLPNKDDYAFDFYLDSPVHTLPPDKANFKESALNRSRKVGSYAPNRLGLFDMHGNVFEWCDDALVDKEGGQIRAIRGGAWHDPAEFAQAANTNIGSTTGRYDGSGLRLARVSDVKK